MATLTDTQLEQALTVEQWRHAVLTQAGYPKALAHTIAACTDIDLHTATKLIDQGCTPQLAARILL